MQDPDVPVFLLQDYTVFDPTYASRRLASDRHRQTLALCKTEPTYQGLAERHRNPSFKQEAPDFRSIWIRRLPFRAFPTRPRSTMCSREIALV